MTFVAYSLLILISFFGIKYLSRERYVLFINLNNAWYFFFIVFIVLRSSKFIIQNETFNEKYYYAIFLTAILFPLSVMLTNIIFGKKNKKKQLIKPNIGRKYIYFLLFLYVIFILITIIYIRRIPTIAVINSFIHFGASKDIVIYRQSITTNFRNWHWFQLVFYILIPFVAIYTNILNKTVKKNWTKVIFSLYFLLAVFTTVAPGHKGYFLIFLFLIWLSNRIYANDFSRIRLIKIIIGMLLILTVFYTISYGFKKDIYSTYINIQSSIFDRITLSYTENLNIIFEVFPDYVEFLHGKTFPNPGNILSYKALNLSNIISNYKYYYSSNSFGNAPSIFFAEFYANFGFFVMMLSVFCMGVVLSLIQNSFFIIKKDPLNVAIYLIIASRVMFLANSSISELFGPRMIGLVLVYLYLKITLKICMKTNYSIQ